MEKPLFPATYIQLPAGYEGQRAAFYLAAEEYVATTMPEANYLMTWQIAPTVVMGRNQDAKAEVDLDFCGKEGIDVIRRKSGGGSIYADYGNIMTSLVTGNGAVEPIFAEYSAMIAGCLSHAGAEVKATGRNDIQMADGGKVCGNAFYHLAHSNIVHGTMLYDTDARLMKGALTPEKAKLHSKGVKSVESRISLLKDALPLMNVECLRNHIREYLTDRTIVLTAQDVAHITEIEKGYYDPVFLYGKDGTATGHTHGCRQRIAGCGTVSLTFNIMDGKITGIRVEGDYFELAPTAITFHHTFYGCPFDHEAMIEAVKKHTPYDSIRGLDLSSMCGLIDSLFVQNVIW